MRYIALALLVLLAACNQTVEIPQPQEEPMTTTESTSLATFAGGCFWCMEPPFEKLEGVLSVTSGYAGGEEAEPTYKEVSSGSTGHREAVQIAFDPGIVTYQELLDVYWRQIDPADESGSFVDRGFQYTSAIFYHDEEQQRLAEESKTAVKARFGKESAVAIEPFTSFYAAEDYHQDYYKKNPLRYKYYRSGSGRDNFIESTWFKDNSSLFEDAQEARYVKPSEDKIKEMLTPLQYKVTQEEGTEPAFKNAYWDNEEDGIYVDIVTGEPLFSSIHKYESGTGWPSFTEPLEPSNIGTKEDNTLFSKRTEVHSKVGGTHLGHVFNDGPRGAGGLRYCMNSASLRFIAKEDLEKEGYGQYLELFD